MIKKLKEKLRKKKKEGVEVKSRQAKTLREKIEGHTEAITFAEAGLQTQAQEMIREEIAEKAKVVVVGHDDTFSKEVMDYAIGFAERMGYEIVALNVGPITKPNTEALGPYCDLVRSQFEKRCEENVEAFEKACEEKGIPFRHVVKFGEVDDCIREVHDELKRVEFVIADPESCPEEGKVAIPVFCMAQ
ncbi:MAG TPA: universal stress protein [Deltaproteobacteria bacterium]|nr:universal stress protein [Deltaproteobacteria bacterium]